MKLSNKTIFCLFLFFAIFLFFLILKWPDKSIKITICDVGQGDSILIQQGFFQLLIDSGRDDRVLGCLGSVLPFWDRVIEVGIVTHFDTDHMGYFGEIMGMFQWQELYFLQPRKTSAEIKSLLEVFSQANELGTYLKEPILGQTIVLPSGAKVTLLEITSINQSKTLSENNRSVGTLLEYGKTKWLFTGGGEVDWEESLLAKSILPQVDVLKIAHHGAETSSSLKFLDKLQPKIAVISVGKNSYGHPQGSVLDLLIQTGSLIFRTDESGDITFSSDGENIWLDKLSKRP